MFADFVVSLLSSADHLDFFEEIEDLKYKVSQMSRCACVIRIIDAFSLWYALILYSTMKQ